MLTTPRRAQLGLLAAVMVFCSAMGVLSTHSFGRTIPDNSPSSMAHDPDVTAVEKNTRPNTSAVIAMKRP
jgi:hypothetical protein